MFDDIMKHFDKIDKKHKIMWEEYIRRVGGSPPPKVSIGDKVIVNAGLLMRGHIWIRKICTVLEVAETSCLVRHEGEYKSDNWEEWIDLYIITDVIEQSQQQEASHE